MLFTYGNCRCCKNESANVKVALNNLFPAGICDMIRDHQKHPRQTYNSGKAHRFLPNRDAITHLFK